MMHLFALRTLNLKSTQQKLPIKIPKPVKLRGELVTWRGGCIWGKQEQEREKAGHNHAANIRGADSRVPGSLF